jgi:predicted nucleotidyltransferase
MATLENSGVPERAINAIAGTLRRHPRVRQAILYGSRAMGTHRPGSDIDLTLKGDLDHAELLLIETELDDLMLPYKIDLSLFYEIDNRALIEHIERVGLALYRAEQQETD